jgi:putative transposase
MAGRSVTKDYAINIRRIRRFYRLMCLEAIVPKPHTSKAAPGHKVYPYFIRGFEVMHSNHVWAMDITHVPIAQGFL